MLDSPSVRMVLASTFSRTRVPSTYLLVLSFILFLHLTFSQPQSLSSLLTLETDDFLQSHYSSDSHSHTLPLNDVEYVLELLDAHAISSAEAEQRLLSIMNSNPDGVPVDPLGVVSFNLAQLHKSSAYASLSWNKYKHFTIQAAFRGSPHASFDLAFMIENSWFRNMSSTLNSYMEKESNLKLDAHVYFHPDMDKHNLALMYYTVAALNEHPHAQMTLGYRYLNGIHVKKRCEKAAVYYQKAAASATEKLKYSHIILQNQIDRIKLSDKEAFSKRQQSDDLLKFFKYSAEKGVANSQLLYGYMNLYGIRDIPQNIEKAEEMFLEAGRNGEYSGFASLGKIYAFGIGDQRQDNDTALKFYKKGVELEDPAAMNGLGVMYLKGHGVPQDVEQAYYYFNRSASEGVPEAQFNLGLLYLVGNGVNLNYRQAYHYMTLAAQQALPQAQYYLGLMNLNGWGTPKSCATAVKFFRFVSERGHNVQIMDRAFDKYKSKQHAESLLYYDQLAATGDEIALENAAYMFDKQIGSYKYFRLISEGKEVAEGDKSSTAKHYAKMRALNLYTEATHLGIVDAHVKVGDYYYYGRGTSSDLSQAVYHYRKASQKNNARATFNLGYMHENGLGLPQDFFLAKRYYDMATTFDEAAKIPCDLALAKLYIRWGLDLLQKRALGGVLFNQFEMGNDNGENEAGINTESTSASIYDSVMRILSILKDPKRLYSLLKQNDSAALVVLIVIFAGLSYLRRFLDQMR